MLIRQLEYFVALAREGHFARAAEACFVSQPALSDALRKLEAELGVTLVQRGRAYEGLTPEGERLLPWARRVLADHDALRDEAAGLRAGLRGRLRIGVVPAASTTAAPLLSAFAERHPLVTLQLNTKLAGSEIVRRILAFELDAGITYAGSEVEGLRTVPLYRDRSVLIASTALLGGRPDRLTWGQVGELPLAQIETTMHGRGLTDAAFAAAGVVPSASVVVDSIAALHSLVRAGRWAAIVPAAWSAPFELGPEVHSVELDPEVAAGIVLATHPAEPAPPLAAALREAAVGLRARPGG